MNGASRPNPCLANTPVAGGRGGALARAARGEDVVFRMVTYGRSGVGVQALPRPHPYQR